MAATQHIEAYTGANYTVAFPMQCTPDQVARITFQAIPRRTGTAIRIEEAVGEFDQFALQNYAGTIEIRAGDTATAVPALYDYAIEYETLTGDENLAQVGRLNLRQNPADTVVSSGSPVLMSVVSSVPDLVDLADVRDRLTAENHGHILQYNHTTRQFDLVPLTMSTLADMAALVDALGENAEGVTPTLRGGEWTVEEKAASARVFGVADELTPDDALVNMFLNNAEVPTVDPEFFGAHNAVELNGDLFIVVGNRVHDKNGAAVLRVTPEGAIDFEIELQEQGAAQIAENNGRIYVVGQDATEPGWEWGNVYVRGLDGEWTKHRNVPNAVHVTAQAFDGDRWYVGYTEYDPSAPIYSGRERTKLIYSDDHGETWHTHSYIELGIYWPTTRVYSLAILGDRMYAGLYRGTSYIRVYECDFRNSTSWLPNGVRHTLRASPVHLPGVGLVYCQEGYSDLWVISDDGSYTPYEVNDLPVSLEFDRWQWWNWTVAADGYLYAKTAEGIYRTADLETWLLWQATPYRSRGMAYWSSQNAIMVGTANEPTNTSAQIWIYPVTLETQLQLHIDDNEQAHGIGGLNDAIGDLSTNPIGLALDGSADGATVEPQNFVNGVDVNGVQGLRLNENATNEILIGAAGGGSFYAGDENTLIGQDAGKDSMTGYIVAIGAQAAEGSGGRTVAIGFSAARETTGEWPDDCVAIGDNALNSNIKAKQIAIGSWALGFNEGATSVGIGVYAGQNNRGESLVAIGTHAARDNEGANVTALGHQAAYRQTQNANSVMLGYRAGYQASAIGNTVGIGWNALSDVYGAKNGVYIGYEAGLEGAADYGMAIGYQACAAGEGSIALGAYSYADGPNIMRIGSGDPHSEIKSMQIVGNDEGVEIVGHGRTSSLSGVEMGRMAYEWNDDTHATRKADLAFYVRDHGGEHEAIRMRADGTRALIITDLPTSDPHVVGAIWNDSGTVKVSAG